MAFFWPATHCYHFLCTNCLWVFSESQQFHWKTRPLSSWLSYSLHFKSNWKIAFTQTGGVKYRLSPIQKLKASKLLIANWSLHMAHQYCLYDSQTGFQLEFSQSDWRSLYCLFGTNTKEIYLNHHWKQTIRFFLSFCQKLSQLFLVFCQILTFFFILFYVLFFNGG